MLRHLQADRIPFDNYDLATDGRKYNFSSDDLYFGNADKVAWSEISHVNYTGVHNSLPKADFRLIVTIYKKNWPPHWSSSIMPSKYINLLNIIYIKACKDKAETTYMVPTLS